MRSALPVIVGAMVIASGAMPTAQWPSFRGESARGVGTGKPPISWDLATGTNVAWKTALPGLGHSSPVVWGDRVYVTTAVPLRGTAAEAVTGTMEVVGVEMARDMTEHEWRLYALDRTTGKILWQQAARKTAPSSQRHRKSSHASATPATDGKYVVAMMGSEGLFCYDAEGRLLWKKDFGLLDLGMIGNPQIQWGPASSPVITGDRVIVQNDGQKPMPGQPDAQPPNSFLAAFELATGKQLWRVATSDQPSWSTPLVVKDGERTLVITTAPLAVRARDAANGKEVWRMDDEAAVRVPSPIPFGDSVLVTGGAPPAGRPILAIPLASPRNVARDKLAWQIAKGSPYTVTPLVYDGILYVLMDNGVLSAYDAATRAELYRIRLGAAKSGFSASPMAANGHLYIANEDGDLFVVRAGKAFDLSAMFPFNETIFATPALDGNLLIVRTRGHLIALGAV